MRIEGIEPVEILPKLIDLEPWASNVRKSKDTNKEESWYQLE